MIVWCVLLSYIFDWLIFWLNKPEWRDEVLDDRSMWNFSDFRSTVYHVTIDLEWRTRKSKAKRWELASTIIICVVWFRNGDLSSPILCHRWPSLRVVILRIVIVEPIENRSLIHVWLFWMRGINSMKMTMSRMPRQENEWNWMIESPHRSVSLCILDLLHWNVGIITIFTWTGRGNTTSSIIECACSKSTFCLYCHESSWFSTIDIIGSSKWWDTIGTSTALLSRTLVEWSWNAASSTLTYRNGRSSSTLSSTKPIVPHRCNMSFSCRMWRDPKNKFSPFFSFLLVCLLWLLLLFYCGSFRLNTRLDGLLL